jgi:glycosyltransferase involved in cell wall biosynthesis
MKILLINHYAGSQRMGMEFRPYYMACEWKKLGHEVKIIAGSYSHLRQSQPRSTGWHKEEEVDYLWLWTNKYTGNGIMRFISMLLFTMQLLIRSPLIAMKLKPDTVIASSTYPLDIFPSIIIAKLARAKLIFEIHDLWPMSPMELGNMSKLHPFILIMRFAEWFAYKFSDKIISILPCAYEHVVLDGVKKENFLHIPNGIIVDPDCKESDKSHPVFSALIGLKNKGHNIIAYAGSIGVANNIDNLVQSALLLKDEPVSIVIIGEGPERVGLENFVRKNNLTNIIFVGKIAKNLIGSVLQKVDFVYLGLKKRNLYRFGTSQNKIYDYMLAARPIIQAFEAGNDPVTEVGCGFSVAAEDPKALAVVIKKAIKMPKKKLEQMGMRGRKYVLEHHNYGTLAKQFMDFISG